MTQWVRPQLSPGSRYVRVLPIVERSSRLHTFWSRLVSTFSLFDFNGVYRWFTFVGHATKPSTAPALVLAGQNAPRSALWTTWVGLHCLDSFVPRHCWWRTCR